MKEDYEAMEELNLIVQGVLKRMELIDSRLRMMELSKLKEVDNYYTYANAFVELASKVNLSDEDLAARFVGGLTNPNHKLISILDPRTLRQAIAYGKTITMDVDPTATSLKETSLVVGLEKPDEMLGRKKSAILSNVRRSSGGEDELHLQHHDRSQLTQEHKLSLYQPPHKRMNPAETEGKEMVINSLERRGRLDSSNKEGKDDRDDKMETKLEVFKEDNHQRVTEMKEGSELPIEHSEPLKSFESVQPRNGWIYGLTGNKETLLAKVVVSQAKDTFNRRSESELVQSYPEEGSGMIRKLFVIARTLVPSIVFMEEVDKMKTVRMGIRSRRYGIAAFWGATADGSGAGNGGPMLATSGQTPNGAAGYEKQGLDYGGNAGAIGSYGVRTGYGSAGGHYGSASRLVRSLSTNQNVRTEEKSQDATYESLFDLQAKCLESAFHSVRQKNSSKVDDWVYVKFYPYDPGSVKELKSILARRGIGKGNQAATKIVVQESNCVPKVVTWRFLLDLLTQLQYREVVRQKTKEGKGAISERVCGMKQEITVPQMGWKDQTTTFQASELKESEKEGEITSKGLPILKNREPILKHKEGLALESHCTANNFQNKHNQLGPSKGGNRNTLGQHGVSNGTTWLEMDKKVRGNGMETKLATDKCDHLALSREWLSVKAEEDFAFRARQGGCFRYWAEIYGNRDKLCKGKFLWYELLLMLRNQVATEILGQWKDGDPRRATCKLLSDIQTSIPNCTLEDKGAAKGEVLMQGINGRKGQGESAVGGGIRSRRISRSRGNQLQQIVDVDTEGLMTGNQRLEPGKHQ